MLLEKTNQQLYLQTLQTTITTGLARYVNMQKWHECYRLNETFYNCIQNQLSRCNSCLVPLTGKKKPKSKQTNKNMAMLVRGPSREPNTIIL